jgi:hypothetical protein
LVTETIITEEGSLAERVMRKQEEYWEVIAEIEENNPDGWTDKEAAYYFIFVLNEMHETIDIHEPTPYEVKTIGEIRLRVISLLDSCEQPGKMFTDFVIFVTTEWERYW